MPSPQQLARSADSLTGQLVTVTTAPVLQRENPTYNQRMVATQLSHTGQLMRGPHIVAIHIRTEKEYLMLTRDDPEAPGKVIHQHIPFCNVTDIRAAQVAPAKETATR